MKTRTKAPDYYDVSYCKESASGKTIWLKLGRGFPGPKGIQVRMDSIPVSPWDGKLMLFPHSDDE